MQEGLVLIRLLAISTLLSIALVAGAGEANEVLDGIWLFDHAPSYPGVTMMEVSTRGGRTTGTVTTTWYGPIAMQNVKFDGRVVTFDLRNLNDKANPNRRWTGTIGGTSVKLAGDLWFSHTEQIGRRGTIAEAKSRKFEMAVLPPLTPIAPDNLARTPPMGWSSWNKFGDRIDDRTVRAMADYLVSSGLREVGYVYLNIDDGWQGERNERGALQPNDKFPNMRALADYVHARGLKLGIYSSPGPKSCAGYEGSYRHVAQDAQTFADWGIDYLKYDLCSGEWFYTNLDTVKRSYSEMGLALKATGRPIVYSLCEYGRFDVGTWGREVGAHLWRTTNDIADDYKTMAQIGFDSNGNPDEATPGGWNDPDMLEVGNGGMSEDEYRTHMTLWAMLAAPLLMGHDLRLTSERARSLLANAGVIAVDQDTKGIQGRAVYKDGTSEIWAKPLADGSVALALFNRGDRLAQVQFEPADGGFAALSSIYDIWRGTELKLDTTKFSVPAHGAVMLKVRGR